MEFINHKVTKITRMNKLKRIRLRVIVNFKKYCFTSEQINK